MSCPRCGFTDAGEVSCPRCGVVFAKLAARDGAPGPHRPAADTRRSGGAAAGPWIAVAAVALVAGLAMVTRPMARGARPAGSRGPAAAAAVRTELPPPAFVPPGGRADAPPLDLQSEALSPDDRARARDLAARLAEAGEREVREAEDLQARFPGDPELRRLFGSVLLAAAQHARAERRIGQAAEWLQRAAGLADNARPWLALVEVLADTGDWGGAETAARSALALEPRNAWALRALGYALLRQDRGRDAAEALQAALEVQEDPATRALLEHVARGLSSESGMTQQTLSHFNVRYDGAAHESVGREILRALERHYATLAAALDHQPKGSIPVVLFTGEDYYDASGAPAWSGGAYDNLDGRIRIPIGGLTASLTPDIDGTLIHELTHAFVADRTRGVAPRDIHEGLAQYMEGKRAESMLGTDGMRALADGRVAGVYGYYAGALSFVEYLVAQRGQGGMNDLLQAMAATGSVDEAFQAVHGRRPEEMRALWKERLKQQYGS